MLFIYFLLLFREVVNFKKRERERKKKALRILTVSKIVL